MQTRITETLKVTIGASFEKVAKDLSNPLTHPEWGTEFFSGPAEIDEEGTVWIDVPAMGGKTRYEVKADIERGIIDLYLAPGDAPFGQPLPVRLIHNGDGVDVLWTLSKMPDMPEDVWQQGLASMRRELENLKRRHSN
ncbi:MAG: hypothetical protein IIC78_14345 [Chloroflexi bacterium]|nr:hypothetical protein [Chloroflexota bacterium]